ncbi:hypothetical protein [Limimaricola cinnabarinus]|uniref:hypothetical protein n=1 Tax=Limimaricola cinnabarinus TaxID=1125964 RepID=UPI0034E25F1D
MWGVFASTILVVLRHKLRLRTTRWRLGHTALGVVIVLGSVVHALLIEGTMGMASKAVLCALVLAATLKLVFDLRHRLLRAKPGDLP